MTTHTSCPCRSGKSFSTCCKPLLTNAENAFSAKSLMRSRYTAYVVKDTDYLLNTWHHSTRPTFINAATLPDWQNLEVIHSRQGGRNDKNGVVEFKACSLTEGRLMVLHEESRFVKENGRWFYVDGILKNSITKEKPGRNTPCPCGSGKKFKKCCGP